MAEENKNIFENTKFFGNFTIDEEKLNECAAEKFPMFPGDTETDKIYNAILRDLRRAYKEGYCEAINKVIKFCSNNANADMTKFPVIF